MLPETHPSSKKLVGSTPPLEQRGRPPRHKNQPFYSCAECRILHYPGVSGAQAIIDHYGLGAPEALLVPYAIGAPFHGRKNDAVPARR